MHYSACSRETHAVVTALAAAVLTSEAPRVETMAVVEAATDVLTDCAAVVSANEEVDELPVTMPSDAACVLVDALLDAAPVVDAATDAASVAVACAEAVLAAAVVEASATVESTARTLAKAVMVAVALTEADADTAVVLLTADATAVEAACVVTAAVVALA